MIIKNKTKIKNLEAQVSALVKQLELTNANCAALTKQSETTNANCAALTKRVQAAEGETMWQFLFFMRLAGKSGSSIEDFSDTLEELNKEYIRQTFNSSLN